ncbi:MAG: sugar ABC transporter substrate-binding protein, partial [Brachybacterium sp.]|nr:sugar ABC transporter substrate-binding protein [Brachybacterium sp.]
MLNRRTLLATLGAAGIAGTAAACSPSAQQSGDDDSGGGGGEGTLTFRLWDESARAAYEESFAAFTEETGWDVEIEVVPWGDYWTRLPLDVASGSMSDVYWMNSANYVQLQQAGNLLNIDDIIPGSDQQWEQAVIDLYTRDDGLWGVPQLWDSIALFYNQDLVEEADVDPTDLSFDPGADSDPLREAGRALTADNEGRHPGDDGFAADSRETFGFNAAADRQAIIGPFLASNGADWEEDDRYVFDSEEGIEAFAYLADLINEDQIAPSAADTNENGDFARDLFTQGRLGLFQSGPYSLSAIADGAGDSFAWGLAPMVAGPEGRKSLVHGVTAVGNANADEDRMDGIEQLLTWLGSAEGQAPIGEMGIAFPGHVDAQQGFVDFWDEKGVDVSIFVEAAQDPAPADTGSNANAGLMAAMPIFQEVMIGRLSAEEGIPQAAEAGNAE